MQEPQEAQRWQRQWARVLKTTSSKRSQGILFRFQLFTPASEVAKYLNMRPLEREVLETWMGEALGLESRV